MAEPKTVLRRWWLLFIAAAALIGSCIVARPIGHDESQYVAALALLRRGWPYRDFAYLQTPLQPLVLDPLALLPAGWMLPGLRIANGVLGLATLWLVYAATRQRTSQRSAFVAVIGLLCTGAFLFSCSIARNDVLPMALLAAAVAVLLEGVDTHSKWAFATGGLLLGLAASAKISAAIPAAAAVVFLLLRCREYGARALVAFAAGAFVGLLPCTLFGAVAPGAFRFDVIDYSLDAPRQWWDSVGAHGVLEPGHRVMRLLRYSVLGCVLVALAAAAVDRRKGDDRLLLDLMIVGGVVSCYLPEPAFIQYLAPLLPPLFVRFAIALDSLSAGSRKAMLVLTAASCVAGLAHTVSDIRHRDQTDLDLWEALPIARKVAVLADGGMVSTLSPELVAGTGVTLDPRFAAGPFLYRTSGSLAGRAMRAGRAVTWQNVDEQLDSKPPAVVLVGAERMANRYVHSDRLDGPMAAWAVSRGYAPVPILRNVVAYVAPQPNRSCGFPCTGRPRSFP